jgi:hypothetical protein
MLAVIAPIIIARLFIGSRRRRLVGRRGGFLMWCRVDSSCGVGVGVGSGSAVAAGNAASAPSSVTSASAIPALQNLAHTVAVPEGDESQNRIFKRRPVTTAVGASFIAPG